MNVEVSIVTSLIDLKEAVLKVYIFSTSQTVAYWIVIFYQYAVYYISKYFTELDPLCKDCIWKYKI